MTTKLTPDQREAFKRALYALEKEVTLSFLADSLEGKSFFEDQYTETRERLLGYSEALWRTIEELTGETVDSFSFYDVAEEVDSRARALRDEEEKIRATYKPEELS
jgi:hypothetical protein